MLTHSDVIKTAHYFQGGVRGNFVIISKGCDLSGLIQKIAQGDAREVAVSGKREARKVAAAEGAKCWNF